jgi:hypothetical protein
MRNPTLLRRSVIIGVGLLLCSRAYADVYPGSLCKYAFAQAGDTVLSLNGGTKITNGSGANVSVICAAKKEGGTSGAQGVLNTNINAAWTTSSCSFFLTSYDGATTYVYATPTVSNVGSSKEFVWASANPGAVYNYGSHAFSCSIPPSQTIMKYYTSW